MLEKSIQGNVVKYAREHGLLAKKLSVSGPMGNVGWPDFMFLGDSPGPGKTDKETLIIFFMEFKKKGGKLTPLQEEVRKRLTGLGFPYYVIDDTGMGRRAVDQELRR